MWRLLTNTKSASGPFGRMALLQQQKQHCIGAGKFSTGLALLKFNNKNNNNFHHQSTLMMVRMISTIGGRTTKPLDPAAAKSSAAAAEDKAAAAAKTASLLERRRQKWRKFVGEVRLFLYFPLYIGSGMYAAWALLWVIDLWTDREGKREKLRWKLSKMHASTIGVVASWFKKKNGQTDYDQLYLAGNALEKQQEQLELLILPDGKTVINRSAASEWVNVRAKHPFVVETTASSSLEPGVQKIFYFEVLVKENYGEISIGLSGPEFPLLRNNAFVGSKGNSLGLKSDGRLWQFGKNDTEFDEARRKCHYKAGDADSVLGCGLLLFVGREQQAEEGNGGGEATIAGKQEMPGQLFFTRNGKIFGRPLWLPSAADKLTQLYPTVSLRGQGTAVEVNLLGTDQPFHYDLAKHPGLTTT